jgi:glycosyltransferase involved in cell wall biosynthesis
VLGVNTMFPLISETYIHEELSSLVPHGTEIAWFRHEAGPAPMPVPEPVYEDFDRAIAEFRPDAAMIHWLTTVEASLPLLERHELPFGVRAHSFDFEEDALRRYLGHPMCIGAWTYSSPPYSLDGVHALEPIFSSVETLRPRAARRDKVVSLSAGLPKKDWPLLLDALARIHGADRRVIVGVTIGVEENPAELARACRDLPNAPLLQVNMVRPDVLSMLAETAVAVYTLRDDVRFGMPMSIVDALCAGCSVIVPDRPEAIDFAGPHARPYRTAEDIAAHAHEVLAGGPAIEAEWDANREYGMRRFADPERSRRFYEELRGDLDAWRASRSASPSAVRA